MRKIGLGVVMLTGLAAPGCALDDVDVDEAVGEHQAEVVSGNGMSLNGMSLNGMSLNGMSLNGMSLNGTQLAGVTGAGQPVSGAGLVGATLDASLSNGSTLSLRVDSAGNLSAPNADVWAYGVSFHADGGWHPLCGTDGGGAQVLAIPLSGTWNLGSGVAGGGSWSASSSTFTLGCRGTALAKCAELGYKPWKTHAGTLLRDHHQACTRMLRADYCGDGSSWTADGTPINLYDDLGIQSDDAAWAVDAEWTAAGAICTNHIRDFQPGTPSCVADLEDPACGEFEGGALIVDEYGG